MELLDIHHKNGLGTQDRKINKRLHATKFICNIVQMKRTTDDLELLCRMCHTLHHLKQKYGDLPYSVRYR